jgi:hypothetical protein
MIKHKLTLILGVIAIFFASCGPRIKQQDIYVGKVHYVIFYNKNSNRPIQVINYSQDSIDMDMHINYGGTYERSQTYPRQR